MDYIIEINENNLREVLDMTVDTPTVFLFMSPREPHSIEMETMLRQLGEEFAEQFLLAIVNCDNQPMVAAQFQLQTIPTTYFFYEGQPVDAILEPITEQELRIRLANILPKEDELKFNEALIFLQNNEFDKALPLLKSAWEMTDKKNSDFGLLYAETYIAMQQAESAKEVLAHIPLQDRDSRWQGLQDQILLLEQSLDSPEIRQLQEDYNKTKTPEIAMKLANQLHLVGKNEEALGLLFDWLKQDLAVSNGEVQKQFLTLLSAMGNTHPLVPQFRRKLYSLLY
ncbi:co-chaperone YbbN [Pasteurella skyensis]|uniref:Co-chaperone YbbN n=1 Tax=Phocoenobacter skyensis TaxID=97481 RepID=A0AAJ6N8L5_9PAST|nr:co-chaperone YbbN [Pasteurella skyensis]MDP8162057.1 co-chaperone YbbN [Pasteurella skyensis]MDP8172213.1 co-chaperone YbbN [Pasteurella skyensis]MDP8176438.1 co-chaperone YbbN [Pasteurella skyensis]MDP8178327.1 co-chaperone YbbN [Pasteurella skyensis]MDP8182917.1 co-chaperone YbbN [Pasteurella skyensis]